MYERSCQSRFDARYWMLGAGALGRPRGMEWGGRREEGSGWGTHVYLWRIHFNIWQNQYNYVKFKNKIKKKKKKKCRMSGQIKTTRIKICILFFFFKCILKENPQWFLYTLNLRSKFDNLRDNHIISKKISSLTHPLLHPIHHPHPTYTSPGCLLRQFLVSRTLIETVNNFCFHLY